MPISYLSHKEKYEEAIRKATLVFKKIRDLQAEGRDGVDIYMALLGGMLGTSLLREGNPMSVHYVMFLPALMNHGTSDQQAEWISRAWNCNVIGTYAQTEVCSHLFNRVMTANFLLISSLVMELSFVGLRQLQLTIQKQRNL